MRHLISTFVCLAFVKATPIVLPGPSGKITSPGYPTPYADDLNKEWEITAEAGHVIAIKFVTFELEHSYEDDIGPCAYDYVKIIDGDNTILCNLCGRSSIGEYDAPNTDHWFKSKTNKVLIQFGSDYSNEEEFVGFEAIYEIQELNECETLKQKAESAIDDWDEILYCSQDCHNTPRSYYCTCKEGYTLHENKHTCTPNCQDKVLRGDSGVISSPEYPNPYPKLSSCKWTIDVGLGRTINLQFASVFNIEDHFEEGCVYDWLEITANGKSEILCGESAPNDPRLLKTQSNKVEIEFVSDLSLENSGFKLTYTTVKASCEEALYSIENGRISRGRKTEYEFEDEVEFSCNVGYQLEGKRTIKCLHQGRWSDPQPICKIVSCGEPPHKNIPNSEIINYNDKKWTYLEVFTLQCKQWYEMVSGAKTWRCEEDGNWKSVGPGVQNNNLPECKAACGIPGKTSFFTTLISGGKKAIRNEFPWMTLITHIKMIFPSSPFCGASLISPTYILTAAHCVASCSEDPPYHCIYRQPGQVHAWFGIHNRKDDEKDRTNIVYSGIDQVIPHGDYNKPSRWNNDIAVLKLKNSPEMSIRIHPICLPSTAYEFSMVDKLTTKGWLAGWGIYQQSVASEVLVKAEFTVQPDQKKCWDESVSLTKELSELSGTNFKAPEKSLITDNMFCVEATKKSSDLVTNACQGDSGGPFMVKQIPKPGEQIAKYMVAGLVSFGVTDVACTTKSAYTIYTRLNFGLTQWVKTKANL